MEITAGSYYKTRDGRKAFVAAIVPPAPDGTKPTFTVRGYINRSGNGSNWDAVCWREDGSYYRNTAGVSEDLVEPWREPRTKEVWVGLYECRGRVGASWTYNTEDEARAATDPYPLIALKRVTLTEGEFDA